MSRPIRLLLLVIIIASAPGFSGCVGTIYDRTYSYQKNHYKPPEDKKEASAESILGALDQRTDTATAPDAGALPPVDVPAPGGLPAPAPDAAAPAGVPAAPGAIPAPPAPAAPPPAK